MIDRECFYCGTFGGPMERDHFPIPDYLGGTQTVDACRPCHDLKDRTMLDGWDATRLIGSLRRVWDKCERDERLVLAKMIVLTVEASAVMS